MGEAAMELSSEQKEYISDFIRGNLKLWIAENAAQQMNTEKEMAIRERIIRVEESLDKHIEITKMGFEQMNKRFETIDKRFESVDSRFNRLTGLISLGFLAITVLITVFQFLG